LLDPKWSYPIYNAQTARLENGFLTVAPTAEQLQAEKTPEVVLAERTVSGDYTATTRLDYKNLKADEQAGISAFGWRGAAVGISLGGGRIFVWRREAGGQKEVASEPLPAETSVISLRFKVAGGEAFRFSFSTDDKNWREIGGEVTASHVEGARIALVYHATSTTAGARFDWLRVEQN
jgi:hypothetical protein